MTDFLNDNVFHGKNTVAGELIADGGLVVGSGGLQYGESIDVPANNWSAQTRVQVADVTERDALVAWRTANDPISVNRPLLVWRANGSLTGVNEITLNGVDWYAESPLAGDIEMTMAAVAPFGWLLCQGQLLADAAVNYPALWATADPVFRSGGSLRLPDLRGRVPMGAGQGTGLTLRNLGDLTGAESVAITEGQLPSHSHTINHDHSNATAASAGSHTHSRTLYRSDVDDHDHRSGTSSDTVPASAADSGNEALTSVQNNAAGAHTHSVNVPAFNGSSGAVGSGQAHPNVQPSAIVNFKVKV